MENKVYARKPLGNSRFNWKQKDFALSTFNCVGEDMDLTIKNCVEAGFNLLELGWASHEKAWEAAQLCEKHEIDLIFQDLTIMGGMMHRHDDRPVDDNKIREVVKELKDKKHVVGYYVWDEPYCDYLFKEARRQSDILLESDPDALLFSVFPPSYNPGPTWENGEYYDAFEEYVEKLSPPVVSMDYYPLGNYCNLYPGLVYDDEKQLDNSPMWIDLAVARNLAEKYSLPFWFYYQACGVYKTQKLVFPMIRMMMYAAALYGAKGLQSYTLTGTTKPSSVNTEYPRKGTVLLATGEKGEFFEEQKTIHKEFKILGNTLMALKGKGVYHSEDVVPYGKYNEIYSRFKDDIRQSEVLHGELPKRTSAGELCDEYGNNYIFILNRDFYKKLNAEIKLKGEYNIYEVSRKDGKQYLIAQAADSAKVNLDEGDAVLLRIQPKDEPLFTAQYVLN